MLLTLLEPLSPSLTPLVSVLISVVVLLLGVPWSVWVLRKVDHGDPVTRLVAQLEQAIAPQQEERMQQRLRLDEHARRLAAIEGRLRRIVEESGNDWTGPRHRTGGGDPTRELP